MFINVAKNQVAVVVLGIMQDAGLPHAGCRCGRCAAAFAGTRPVEYAACLAVVDSRRQPAAVWLIDATPDIKYQLNLLAPLLGGHPRMPERLRQPDGIFLTHAHMGHVAGLPQLGYEAMNVRRLPVYGSKALVALLAGTPLRAPLANQLELTPLTPNQPLKLAADLTITSLPVPHRDEWGAGTFAYLVAGPARRLLYVPDIDGWEVWAGARSALSAADIILVDGSFYSADELDGRPPVAHPLVPDTLAFCKGLPGQLGLIHLNHTNPLLDEESPERTAVAAAGAHVARMGGVYLLSDGGGMREK